MIYKLLFIFFLSLFDINTSHSAHSAHSAKSAKSAKSPKLSKSGISNNLLTTTIETLTYDILLSSTTVSTQSLSGVPSITTLLSEELTTTVSTLASTTTQSTSKIITPFNITNNSNNIYTTTHIPSTSTILNNNINESLQIKNSNINGFNKTSEIYILIGILIPIFILLIFILYKKKIKNNRNENQILFNTIKENKNNRNILNMNYDYKNDGEINNNELNENSDVFYEIPQTTLPLDLEYEEIDNYNIENKILYNIANTSIDNSKLYDSNITEHKYDLAA